MRTELKEFLKYANNCKSIVKTEVIFYFEIFMVKCYLNPEKHHFPDHNFLSASIPHECHDCVICCFSKGTGHPTSRIGKRTHADAFLKLVFGLDVKFCWSRQN